jgi:hypothetical protein
MLAKWALNVVLPIEFEAILGFKKPKLSFSIPPKILIGIDMLGIA